MTDTYPTPEMKELFAAIMSINNETEAATFFRDLLTTAELAEFANRWQAVKLLREGASYADIAKTLSISTTTVTRVAQWLHHGMGGYASVSERMFGKEK